MPGAGASGWRGIRTSATRRPSSYLDALAKIKQNFMCTTFYTQMHTPDKLVKVHQSHCAKLGDCHFFQKVKVNIN